MAPANTEQDVVEKQLKDIIQDLYQLMVQVTNYDTAGRPTKDVLGEQVKALSTTLQKLHATTTNPNSTLPTIPPELIQYVDNGRNPQIYTREFVELAKKGNQLMKGKQQAFASFRDILAGEIKKAMPELEGDVDRVVAGGSVGMVGRL